MEFVYVEQKFFFLKFAGLCCANLETFLNNRV